MASFQLESKIHLTSLVSRDHNLVNFTFLPVLHISFLRLGRCTDGFVRRAWQLRRFVYTRDMIAFSQIGHDQVLDKIPLHEIIAVELVPRPVNDAAVTGLASLETAVDFSRSFQIRTIPDGYNSGRKYFLQVESDSVCSDLVSTLQDLVRMAVLRSKSPGQRRQELIKKIYNSNVFQSCAAVLIILARMINNFQYFLCLKIVLLGIV